MNQVDYRVEKLIKLCCKLNSDEFPEITKLALDLQRSRGEFGLAKNLGGGLKRKEPPPLQGCLHFEQPSCDAYDDEEISDD